MRRSSTSSIVLAALVGTLLTGCVADRLEDEWAVTLEQMEGRPLVVADSLPPRDAVGIGREMAPYLLFSRPLGPTESVTLTLDGPDGPVPTQPRRDSDDLGVRLVPPLLLSDAQYTGTVQLLGAPATPLDYTTAAPAGPAFNMSTGLEVEAFGAGTGQLGVVNALFQPGVFPLWILRVDGLGEPASLAGPLEVRFAPGRIDEEVAPHHIVHVEWGFVSVFSDVTATDGRIDHTAPSLFLPLWSSEAVHLLRMTDVRLTGTISVDGAVSVPQLTLTGVLGTRSLRALSRASEGWRLAIDGARLDVDTNGNGVPDAATFTFSTTPTAVDPTDIDG